MIGFTSLFLSIININGPIKLYSRYGKFIIKVDAWLIKCWSGKHHLYKRLSIQQLSNLNMVILAKGQKYRTSTFRMDGLRNSSNNMYFLFTILIHTSCGDASGSGVAGNRSSQLELEDEAAKCESLAEGKHISVSKICQDSLSALRFQHLEY